MASDFILPDLGEGIHEAQIIQLLVKEGDAVKEDQPLMEVETDKAAVEIPSPREGTISKIHVKAGQTVNVGDALITFGGAGSAAAEKAPPQKKKNAAAAPAGAGDSAAKPTKKAAPKPEEDLDEEPAAEPDEDLAEKPAAPRGGPATEDEEDLAPAKANRPAKVAAAPAVRRLAKEAGIDLSTMQGSGPGGRITRDDLERTISGERPTAGRAPSRPTSAAAAAAGPQVGGAPVGGELPDFSKWGPVRRQAISQIRKTIAQHMVRSEAFNVHVTHHDMADIEMLEQLRKEHNARRREGDPKLTLLPFVMKAVQATMRKYPQFNASFDSSSNEMIYKEYYHFGVAVDTPRGLVVPVVRDVDKKPIRELARELEALGQRTRDASFALEELRGGTFTITNIGSLGGVVSTPIINYPEVAILGLGKAEMRPVVRNGQVVPRYMLPLNLSFDHRVIDGADAARFASEVMGYLEVPGRLLLED